MNQTTTSGLPLVAPLRNEETMRNWILALTISVIAACAVERPPAEATTDQHLIAWLPCDDVFGCEDAAEGRAGSMIANLFGISHAAGECDMGSIWTDTALRRASTTTRTARARTAGSCTTARVSSDRGAPSGGPASR